MTDALVTRGLTKTYGGVAAVDHLDLRVPAGLLYGFLGPNGAGKTTTIRMLLGLIHPTSGSAEVLGEAVSPGRGTAVLRRVGALVEEPAAYRYLSGRRNLEYFARVAGPRDDARRRLARVDEVLALVDLTAAAGKRVRAYSQGMRQRLGIARALLGAPEVLVLDEPTNGLDPQGIAEIRALLRRLADDGTTVFVSSHLLAEVEAVCDRVGVLAHGRLVAEGPPSNLRPAGTRLRVAVDDPARALALLATLPGVTPETPDASAGAGGAGAEPGAVPVRPGAAPVPAGATANGAARAGTAAAAPAPASAPRDVRSTVLRVRLADGTGPRTVNAALVGAGVAVDELALEHERLEDVFLDLVGGADAPR